MTDPHGLDELSSTDITEIRRCARALLRHPLLHLDSSGGELLPLIYRHRDVLRRLFAMQLGYSLTVERRHARLYKVVDAHWGRGNPDFTPRTYAYLALTLACLVDSGRQILLSKLVAEVRAAAAEAGVEVTEQVLDLRALAAALRHLVGLGVLQETEGQVSVVARTDRTEALITIDTELLALTLPLHRLAAVEANSAGPTDAGHAVGIAARRRLVEDPVLLYADLPPEEAQYLRSHLSQESLWAERLFGLQLEARAEGVLTVDPDEQFTDHSFPSESTPARMALLALPQVLASSRLREQDGCCEVSEDEIRHACADLAVRYPDAWAKGELAKPDRLLATVTGFLLDCGLARKTADGQYAFVPAAHRWHPQATNRASAGRETNDGAAADESGGLW
jgi:uncharacterized protein (TIGR02678 family)